uniref:Uncharacterized protein n=1 Tax=Medicago truncatula TaxID=3880 RepID=I3T904_MEDTR|nr:unknown [Medicago truncatula]
MRNVHTDATRESIRVSIDFFRFIAESMLFTVGRRLLTLLSFELMPPNVERWKTSAPSVACACDITPSICPVFRLIDAFSFRSVCCSDSPPSSKSNPVRSNSLKSSKSEACSCFARRLERRR